MRKQFDRGNEPGYRAKSLFYGLAAVAAANAAVLPDEIVLSPAPFFENSSRVVSPDRACPDGRLAVLGGAPYVPSTVFQRPLLSAGSPDLASPTVAEALPLRPKTSVGTDNSMVRLKNGRLLAIKNGSAWSRLRPAPSWAGEYVTDDGGQLGVKGKRGAIEVFISDACGQNWKVRSVIDFGVLAGGKYGIPRTMDSSGNIDVSPDKQAKDTLGHLRWWIGGGDRTELYACPYTGIVYLTTRVVSGPYPGAATFADTYLLLWSRDGGGTWEILKDDLPSWEPLVMTSTPDGRLFLFQLIGSQPTLFFTKAPVTVAAAPEFSPAYPAYFADAGGNQVKAGTDTLADIYRNIPQPAISRVSADTRTSAVRVAYPALNAYGRQVAEVVDAEVIDPESAPRLTPAKTVRATDEQNYSVTYTTFIDPDPVAMPASKPANTAVLYWIEARRRGLPGGTYATKYMVFDGPINTSCPDFLSVAAGQPRTWDMRRDPGDYMTAGGFWDGTNLGYAAQWPDPAGIKANYVTLPYQPPAQAPDMHVTAVWRPADGGEIQAYDSDTKALRKKYDELWPQGWRLHDIRSRVVEGQLRYTAVWRPGDDPEIQVYGWSYSDFRKKYDELWPQGWRLALLDNAVVDGQVLYTAVWRQGSDPEIQVYGWSYADFRAKYDELWPQGWRLHILNPIVVGDQVLYTAVWRQSQDPEIQVYGWSYADFRAKYDELWPQGWRLGLLREYDLGGTRLYTAVWRPGDGAEIQVYDWSYPDFRRKYDELWCQGYRLREILPLP